MDNKILYISDLDGTLLNSDSLVSGKSALLLTAFSEGGGLFTVATARTPATVVPLLSEVHSTVPFIVMTGAAMWDRKSESYINTRFLEERSARDVISEFSKAGIRPFVYCLPEDTNILQVYHSSTLSPRERDFYLERSHLKLKKFNLGTPVPEELHSRTLLVFGIAGTEQVDRLASILKEKDSISVSAYPDIFIPDCSLIEVFAAGVSKASAIKNLKERVSASGTVVFGDNLNDLPMFAVADRAVAVGNALDKVKEAADVVIGRNYEDAVAEFIISDSGK